MVKPLGRRRARCAAICSIVVGLASPLQSAPSTLSADTSTASAATTQSTDSSADEKAGRIRALEGFYAKTYSQPLADKNRLSQLIAIVSLARIDGEPLTRKLLDSLGNPDVLVAQLAWEGLNARYASLNDAQRTAWIVGGFDIAKRGGFPGATIVPLLDAATTIRASGLKTLPEAVLTQVIETNDPSIAEGKPAIAAAGRALSAWADARLVQTFVSRMNTKPALAARIAAMLSALPGAPAPNADANATKTAWAKYTRDVRLTPPTTRPAYAPTATLLPIPQKILDADDPKWRRELELDALNLDAVELAFCIDATGSMTDANEFVIAYVETISRLLHIMSDKVRVGTVYYRHEIDPAIMLDCCKSVPTRPKDFFTRVLALTPDATALIQQMHAQKPPGRSESGHQRLGAYVAGITTAMRGMQWAPKGMKIIACTGDASITTGSGQAMVDAARAAKGGGFLLMFVVENPTAAAQVGPASRAATGLDPLLYKTDIDRLKQDKAQENAKGMLAAIDRFKGSSFETMTVRVLELTLPNDYRDRVRPLMAAVLPILAAQDSSDRAERLVGGR